MLTWLKKAVDVGLSCEFTILVEFVGADWIAQTGTWYFKHEMAACGVL